MSAMGSLLLAAGFALCGVAVAAATERRGELVHYNDVQIDVVIDGNGPAVVLLPSLARDSDDYDELAEGLAADGFRVLRPKPRGIGRSTGPMAKVTLHDFARDIAETVKAHGNGKAVGLSKSQVKDVLESVASNGKAKGVASHQRSA